MHGTILDAVKARDGSEKPSMTFLPVFMAGVVICRLWLGVWIRQRQQAVPQGPLIRQPTRGPLKSAQRHCQSPQATSCPFLIYRTSPAPLEVLLRSS